MPDLLSLPQLAARLVAQYGETSPGYRQIYNRVVDGRLPTVQMNGRYYVRESDLEMVASLFGLSATNAAA